MSGLTGLIENFNKIIPLPVVRGLQLGLGALLVKKGVALLDHSVRPTLESKQNISLLLSLPFLVVSPPIKTACICIC